MECNIFRCEECGLIFHVDDQTLVPHGFPAALCDSCYMSRLRSTIADIDSAKFNENK